MLLLINFFILVFLGIFCALAVSFYNLYSVKWGLSSGEQREFFSGRWHLFSWLLRFFIFMIILFAGMISGLAHDHTGFISLLYINAAFTGYNLIYNKGFDHKWYYTGSKNSNSGSFLDKILGMGIIVLEGLLLLFTILWYPVKLVRIPTFLVNQMKDRPWDFIVTALIAVVFFVIYKVFFQKK